jgi:O-antigen ligase
VQRITGFNAGFSGVAGNPNDLALTLNLMIPLAVALCMTEKPMLARAVAALALLLSVAGVIVTFSRAGFLALAAIVIFLVIAAVRRAPAVGTAIVLATVLLTPALLPSGYTQRLTTIADISTDPTGSAQGRWADLAVAADLVTYNPVFGVGLGQNVLALNRERGPMWREVHNAYLQYALDLGLPGLLLFLWLFIAVFRSARRVRRLSKRAPALRTVGTFAESAQIALTAFAIAALFYPVAYYFYFFLIGGFAVAVANVCRAQVASRRETAALA